MVNICLQVDYIDLAACCGTSGVCSSFPSRIPLENIFVERFSPMRTRKNAIDAFNAMSGINITQEGTQAQSANIEINLGKQIFVKVQNSSPTTVV